MLYEVGGDNFDDLAQDCSNSIANALELMQSIHACLSNCLSISQSQLISVKQIDPGKQYLVFPFE